MEFNGHKLFAAIPMFRAGKLDHFVIVVESKYKPGEFVNATVASLDETSWSWGHYYSTLDSCLADAYLRSAIVDTGDVLREISSQNVISR